MELCLRAPALLAIASCLLPGAAIADDQGQLVQRLEDAQKALSTLLSSPPPPCTDLSSILSSNRCSFRGLCDAFSANQAGPTLYVNAKGESIPNYGLQYAEQTLDRCYLIKASGKRGDTEVIEASARA